MDLIVTELLHQLCYKQPAKIFTAVQEQLIEDL